MYDLLLPALRVVGQLPFFDLKLLRRINFDIAKPNTLILSAGRAETFVISSSDKMIGEIAPELTGHGLPLGKCEAYNRVYDQFSGIPRMSPEQTGIIAVS